MNITDKDGNSDEINLNIKKNIIKSETVPFYRLLSLSNSFDKVVIVLMVISSAGVGLAFPLNILIFKSVVNIIVNPVKPASYSDSLRPLIINFALLASAALVCGFIQMVCISVTYVRQNRLYKHRFYTTLLRQNIGWFDMQQTGQMATRMSDNIESITVAIADKLAQFIQVIVSFGGSVLIASINGWKLTLVGCTAVPILCVTFFVMLHFIKQFSVAQVKSYAEAGGIAEEILSDIRTVVAFNGQRKEADRYRVNLSKAEKYGVKRGIIQGIGLSIVGFTVFAVGSLVFYLGIEWVREGFYEPGVVVQIFLSIVIGSIALGTATSMIETFILAKAAAYPIFEIINRKPIIDVEKAGIIPEIFEADIHFKNVYFEYPARPGVQILKDFTFTIPKGKTVAFIGPSGSGKSTIINLLQRFYDPISGTVSLGDIDLKSVDLKWYKSHIAVVHQEPRLFSGTVEENIRFGKLTASFDEIVQSAQKANAHDFIMKTKEQFETKLGDLGAGFSGGQKQRIALATALVRGPSLLLLDEATSALDNKSEEMVQQTIDQSTVDQTVVMVAHRLQTVRNADIIVVMNNGEIVEQGSHSILTGKKGLYYEMLQVQKRKSSIDEKEEEEELSLPNLIVPKQDLKESSRRRLSSTILTDVTSPDKLPTKCQILTDQWRIIQMNKPERCALIIGMLASTIVGSVFPAASLIYSEMFMVFSYQNDPTKMIALGHFNCALMLIPAFTLLISQLLKISCLGMAGEALTTRIRSKLMEAMLKQEMAWFDRPENIPGVLTGRLSLEASLVKGTAGIQLSIFIEAIVNVVLAMLIAFYFSWMLTLLFLIFIPFITLAGIMQGKLSSNQTINGSDAVNSSSLVMETLNNIRTVQSLGLQKHFADKFLQSLKPPTVRKNLNLFFFGVISAFSVSAVYYAYCVIFFVGAILIDQHKIQMIHLMRVFSCLTMSSAALGRAMSLTPDAEKARRATRRTLETLDRVTEIDAGGITGVVPEEKLSGNIDLKDIYFRYPSRMNVSVLRGLNLTINVGETVAIVGRSGCGKSTLAQLLERFYDPLQPTTKPIGQILLDGRDLKSLNLCWVRDQIGIVKQEPSLFNISIAENIAYGSNDEPQLEDIQSAAKIANIHDFIMSLPKGYDTKAGQRGGHFSGGQKQQICIARALYRKPPILLMDEATSALDSQSEKGVQEALDRARENCTCIIIAHRLSTIQNANKIVVMDNGRVTEMGTHEELMLLKGRYFELNNLNSER